MATNPFGPFRSPEEARRAAQQLLNELRDRVTNELRRAASRFSIRARLTFDETVYEDLAGLGYLDLRKPENAPLRTALNEASERFLAFQRRRFARLSSSPGRWPKLAYETIRTKQWKKQQAPEYMIAKPTWILRESDTLYNSISVASEARPVSTGETRSSFTQTPTVANLTGARGGSVPLRRRLITAYIANVDRPEDPTRIKQSTLSNIALASLQQRRLPRGTGLLGQPKRNSRVATDMMNVIQRGLNEAIANHNRS